MRKLLLAILMGMSVELLLAQFSLVKDINLNPGTPDATSNSSPGHITLMNGVTYFAATHDAYGFELWKTDGTEAGTVLLKDICFGNNGSSPANFIVFSNAIYFQANDGLNGLELWKTDGTSEGTVMVKDINPGTAGSSPDRFVVYNNALYFRATTADAGAELWKTDGTEAGTQMVKNIYTGTSGSNPNYFKEYNGKLYFAADDATGNELWVTDGSIDGTIQIADINTSTASASSSPQQFCVYNNKLYFQATNGNQTSVAPLQYGTEIWVYNGTTVERLTDLNMLTGAANFNGNSTPTNLTVFNGKLYFAANNKTNGFEIWESDGIVGGTTRLFEDLYAGSTNSSPGGLIVWGSYLYFYATDATYGQEIWKTDGVWVDDATMGNVTLVKDLQSGATGSNPSSLFIINNTLYCIAAPTVTGQELYKVNADGTDITLVKEINASGSAFISYPTAINATQFLLQANNNINGSELWISDGTDAGTLLLKDINSGYSASVNKLTKVNNSVYFQASNGAANNGIELWVSNGTSNGTSMVSDINSGTANSSPTNLCDVNGTLFFQATTAASGIELWKSNSGGTSQVKEIAATTTNSSPAYLTNVNGTLFFAANDQTTNGNELWKSEGNDAGTVMVKNINTLTGASTKHSNPTGLTNANGVLYFAATNGSSVNGIELWKSDGTDAGTVMVMDIATGTVSSSPANLTYINGNLFFTANDGTNGIELWMTNCSTGATAMVKNIDGAATSSTPSNLTNVNGTLYFTATDATNGTELWKSDGTDAGTVLVKDIYTGTGSAAPSRLINLKGLLVFTATDATNGTELWKSDGTNSGTVLIKNITSSASTLFSGAQVAVDDEVYFIANNQLWKTNGTEAGTLLVGSLPNGSFGNEMVQVGDTLFFNAYNSNGQELWVHHLMPGAPQNLYLTNISTTGFTANWTAISIASAYYIDVATDASFTNILASYNNLNIGNVTSYDIVVPNRNTPYYVRVRAYDGIMGSNSSSVMVIGYQTITFNAILDKTLLDVDDFAPGATTNSGLAISYTSSNTGVAEIINNKIHIVALGQTTITASQPGNSEFAAATSVDQVLNVVKADQTITFNPLIDRGVGEPDFDPQATSTSGLAITYTSSNTNVATIINNKVHFIAIGTTTITASQAGNNIYNPAADVSQTLNVTSRASQVITFEAIPEKTYGDMPFDLVGSTTSGLDVVFTSNDESIAQISGTTVSINGAGTAIITASQPGNDSYNAGASVTRELVVKKAAGGITVIDTTIVYNGTPKAVRVATLPEGMDVDIAYNELANQPAEGGNYMVVATINNANYVGVDTGLLVISPAAQVITFNALNPVTFGDGSFKLNAKASSGLEVTYSSSNTQVATVLDSTVSIIGAGTTTITVSQAGNNNYQAASNVQQTLTVVKKNQLITFDALSDKTFGDAAFNLTATANSGLNVSYASSNTQVATVDGNTVTIHNAGIANIIASQAGNDNYNAATNVTQELHVLRTAQTITFNELQPKTYGDSAFIIAANSTSGLPVTFASNNSQVATVQGDTITIIAAGTAIITASQAGNENYLPATDAPQTLKINKKNQTISFSTIGEKLYGDADFTLTATASSSLGINYTSSNLQVATIQGNTVTIVGVGSAIITALQTGDANYNPAADAVQTLIVNKGTASIVISNNNAVFDGTAKQVTVSTEPVGLAYDVTYNRLIDIPVNAGIYVVEVIINSSLYEGSKIDTLHITRASQEIAFDAIAPVTYGQEPFALEGFATSGLSVVYSIEDASVATINGSMLTIMGSGSATITAYQAGNDNYLAAIPVQQTLHVSKAAQTISFEAIPQKVIGDAPFDIEALATSGLMVHFTSSNEAVAQISGTTVTIVGVGSTTITAGQEGNNNYLPAESIEQVLQVLPNSVNENLAEQILVYPVPADNFVNIEISSDIQRAIGEIRIINTVGAVVLERLGTDGQNRINIEGLNSGLYFVEVEVDSALVIKKLIIK